MKKPLHSYTSSYRDILGVKELEGNFACTLSRVLASTLGESQWWLLDLNQEELAFVRFKLSRCFSVGPDLSNIRLYMWP